MTGKFKKGGSKLWVELLVVGFCVGLSELFGRVSYTDFLAVHFLAVAVAAVMFALWYVIRLLQTLREMARLASKENQVQPGERIPPSEPAKPPRKPRTFNLIDFARPASWSG